LLLDKWTKENWSPVRFFVEPLHEKRVSSQLSQYLNVVAELGHTPTKAKQPKDVHDLDHSKNVLNP